MIEEFRSTLLQMVSEIDLVFDYVDKRTVVQLREYIVDLEDTVLAKDLIMQFVEDLKPYDENIRRVTDTGKLRTRDLEFLNGLKLFRGILSFDVFKDENKNTKKTLANYLKTMYLAACVASDRVDNLDVYLETIEEEQKQDVGGMDQVFGSLLRNKEIMNMATELTRDLQESNVDPMMIMGSILGGKPNAEVNKLMSSITSKLEQKISSGEINKEELQDQAKNMMSALQSSDLGNSVGDLTAMFGKMK
jgi:hypothetical protein